MASIGFQSTNLRSARFVKTNLLGANLDDGDLGLVKLIHGNLRGTSLVGANLSGAELREVDFFHAKLSYSRFRGANLTSVNLWVLNNVSYDSQETLMKVLKPLIIDPAMKKRQELGIIKAQEPEIISAKDFLAKGKA